MFGWQFYWNEEDGKGFNTFTNSHWSGGVFGKQKIETHIKKTTFLDNFMKTHIQNFPFEKSQF